MSTQTSAITMSFPPFLSWHVALGEFLDAITAIGHPLQCSLTTFDARPMGHLCKGQPILPLPGDWPQRELVPDEVWHSNGAEPLTVCERPALSTSEVLAFSRARFVAPLDGVTYAQTGNIFYVHCVLQCCCVFVRGGKLDEGIVLRQRLAPDTWFGHVCDATFWAYRDLEGLRYHACLASDAFLWASHPGYAASVGISEALERERAERNVSRLVTAFGRILAAAPSGVEWSYEFYDGPRDTVMPGILPLLEAEARRVRPTG